MSGECVADETLPERWEVIRYHCFFRSLQWICRRAHTQGRSSEEPLRERLGSLTAADQDRLLFLIEHGFVPMHREATPQNPVSESVLACLNLYLASRLPTVTTNLTKVRTYCQGIITPSGNHSPNSFSFKDHKRGGLLPLSQYQAKSAPALDRTPQSWFRQRPSSFMLLPKDLLHRRNRVRLFRRFVRPQPYNPRKPQRIPALMPR